MDGQENYMVQLWLKAATAGIRFKPDREAVERELREHLEDKTADLQRIFPDMTYFEAEERALVTMGDAKEIGRELAKIHKPWLGYLWELSRCVLGAAAFFGIMCLVSVWMGTARNGWLSETGSHWSDVVSAVEEGRAVRLEAPEDRAVVNRYTCTVQEAVLVHGESYDTLEFLLRVSSPIVWARAEESPQNHLSAVDSLGNTYLSGYQWREQDVKISGNRMVAGNMEPFGPFYQDYAMWVSGLDPDAEWVRLEYDWLGRSFQITVNLGKGAEA